jgi:hypothetical protein
LSFGDDITLEGSRCRPGDVRLIKLYHRAVGLVDYHLPFENDHPFAGQSDDTLDIIVCIHFRRGMKDDNIAAFRLMEFIDDFIDKQLFSGMKGIVHTRTFDDEFLDNGLETQNNDAGYYQHHYYVAEKGLELSGLLLLFVLLHTTLAFIILNTRVTYQ